MIFYPKKQNDFETLRVSIDKAIYLNREEFFCSSVYHLLVFYKLKLGGSARGKNNRVFKYQDCHEAHILI